MAEQQETAEVDPLSPDARLRTQLADASRVNELLSSELNDEIGRHGETRNRLTVARCRIADLERRLDGQPRAKYLFVWPQVDGSWQGVHVAIAQDLPEARRMVGDSPGVGPPGLPLVANLFDDASVQHHHVTRRLDG